MPPEFSGIERRLSELSERLARLEPWVDYAGQKAKVTDLPGL